MRKSGQAMIEFVVALFAIVILAAGITDFILIASERSKIFATLRGEAGDAVMSDLESVGVADAAVIAAAANGRLSVPEEATLTADFAKEEDKREEKLSPALREWLFFGAKDFVTVGDGVWMPPLRVSGAMAQ